MDSEVEDAEAELKIVVAPIKKQLSLKIDMSDGDKISLLKLHGIDEMESNQSLEHIQTIK